jgi:hypothetical protein
VIASERLYIVEPDGHVALHPEQVGEGVALASNREALFGIFKRDGQRELRRITQGESELVRSLDDPFGALVATDSELALLSWAEKALVLQRFSLSGKLAERVTFGAPSAVAYAELRRAADQLYVVIWGNAAPWVTLGRMTAQHGYEKLAEAGSEIAGPLALGGGTYVARDGAFAALEEGSARIGGSEYVTCLGSYAGLSYACVHGDLMRVDQHGLGAPLFELGQLHEPNYQGLPAPAQRDCMARWLDLREHLANAPAANAENDSAAPDPGPSAARVSDAAVRRDDSEPMPAHAQPGCALGPRSARPRWLNAIALAVLFARCCRRRALRAARSSRTCL